MASHPHAVANVVFCACFFLVTIAGFFAARWKRSDLNSLEEWGLAGRRFGTLVTWFLIGGDFTPPTLSLLFLLLCMERARRDSSPFLTAFCCIDI